MHDIEVDLEDRALCNAQAQRASCKVGKMPEYAVGRAELQRERERSSIMGHFWGGEVGGRVGYEKMVKCGCGQDGTCK